MYLVLFRQFLRVIFHPIDVALKNDDNIDHDHYLINEEIKLDERI